MARFSLRSFGLSGALQLAGLGIIEYAVTPAKAGMTA
jgi:hypothetical protein